jgi:hypothetical protein
MTIKVYERSRVYSSKHARRTSRRIAVAMVFPYALFLAVVAAVVLVG